MSQLRPLGRSSLRVSPLAFGGNVFGWTVDEAASFKLLDAWLDAGFNFVDTADVYSAWVPGHVGGESETIIGKWLKHSGKRNRVVLATKVGKPMGEGKVGLSPKYIREAVEASLKRLQTDYIDLYITHWQDHTTPVAETMDALLSLKKQGKIRAIGVSNATPEILSEYLKHGPVDAAQELYSLIDRGIETTLAPLCAEHNVAVLGYSSLALGLLAGPIDPAREFKGDDQRATNPRFSEANRAKLKAFFDTLEPLRTHLGCSFGQMMIAWTVARGTVSVALCGARVRQQAIENAGAGAVVLDSEALQLIDAAAKRHLDALA